MFQILFSACLRMTHRSSETKTRLLLCFITNSDSSCSDGGEKAWEVSRAYRFVHRTAVNSEPLWMS